MLIRCPLRLPAFGSATPARAFSPPMSDALSPSSSSGPFPGLAPICPGPRLGTPELAQCWAVPQDAEPRGRILSAVAGNGPANAACGCFAGPSATWCPPSPSGPFLPQYFQQLGPSVPGQGLSPCRGRALHGCCKRRGKGSAAGPHVHREGQERPRSVWGMGQP